MQTSIQQDLEKMPLLLQETLSLGLEYLQTLHARPTSMVKPEINWPDLPEAGSGGQKALRQFEQYFLPYIVASSGPRYWGFVTGGTTPAAIAGDWLTAVFDQNTQTNSGVGDCSAILELHTVQLLCSLFGLPNSFNGAMVTGATMANFTGLGVARQWIGKVMGHDIAREGLRNDIPIYTATPHSSILKALSMLGIGSSRIIPVPVIPGREAIDVEALKALLSKKTNEPFLLVASAGTVNTVDFDDFKAIAVLRKDYHFWLHIDAAFGGFASCSPKHASLLDGWEAADSITVDFHKWLNTPYDGAIIFTRKEHASLQLQTFQNTAAPYLGNPEENFNYLNFVPENSRRFRALPVWFGLMAYGKLGYRELVEQSVDLANQFAQTLVQTGYFQLAAPVRLNTVCFSIHADYSHILTRDNLLHALNEEGKVFMTPTRHEGKDCIRAAFVNFRTRPEDLSIAMDAIRSAIKNINPR